MYYHNIYKHINPGKFNINLQKYLKHWINGIELLPKQFPEARAYSCSSISKLNKYIEYRPVTEVLKQ